MTTDTYVEVSDKYFTYTTTRSVPDTPRQTFQMQPERFRINRSNTTDKEDLDSEHDSNHHLDKDSIQIDYGSSRTGLTDASHQV